MNKIYAIIRVFLYTFLVIILISCTTKDNSVENTGIKTIPIEVDAEDTRTFSQLVDSISFLPLETKKEALIGNITKLRFANSRIYILDKYRSNCLFVFDNDGMFLFKIDQQGKGPGEFTDASGFCLVNNQEIAVSDFSGGKIIFYDIEGEFLREIHLDFAPSDIAFLGENLLAVCSYYPNYRLNILSLDGELIRSEFLEEPGHSYVYNNEVITGLKEVYFRDYYEDTIYQVQKDKSIKKYLVDFKDRKMLKSYYLSIPRTNKNGIISRRIPEGLRFGCYNLVETDEYLSFYFWETPQRFNKHWCLYNKTTGQSTYMNVNMDFDDLFSDVDPPQILAATMDKFCFPLESIELSGKWDEIINNFTIKMPDKVEELKAIKPGLSDSANPVLVFFNFISN